MEAVMVLNNSAAHLGLLRCCGCWGSWSAHSGCPWSVGLRPPLRKFRCWEEPVATSGHPDAYAGLHRCLAGTPFWNAPLFDTNRGSQCLYLNPRTSKKNGPKFVLRKFLDVCHAGTASLVPWRSRESRSDAPSV